MLAILLEVLNKENVNSAGCCLDYGCLSCPLLSTGWMYELGKETAANMALTMLGDLEYDLLLVASEWWMCCWSVGVDAVIIARPFLVVVVVLLSTDVRCCSWCDTAPDGRHTSFRRVTAPRKVASDVALDASQPAQRTSDVALETSQPAELTSDSASDASSPSHLQRMSDDTAPSPGRQSQYDLVITKMHASGDWLFYDFCMIIMLVLMNLVLSMQPHVWASFWVCCCCPFGLA